MPTSAPYGWAAGLDAGRPSVAPALWDTAAVAIPIEQVPPRICAAAAAHAAERDQQRAEVAALLERHRAGEPGIVVCIEELLATLGLDQDPPGAGPAV
jgi:hypothetical protein